MAQIQSLGTGLSGASWTDGANWQGGVAPVYASGDTGYIVAPDNFASVPSGEFCDMIEPGAYITDVYGQVNQNYGQIYNVQPSAYINDNYGTIDYVFNSGTVIANKSYAQINNLYGSCGTNESNAYIVTMDYDYTYYSGAGYVGINDGGIEYVNDYNCYVATNNNYIGYLNGTVDSNYLTVNQINGSGIINTNQSTGTALCAPNANVTSNYGYVNNVAGNVNVNYSGGVVDNGDNSGSWGGYRGVIGTNEQGGIVRINGGNNSGGVQSDVGLNKGEITENYGTVSTNDSTGVIYLNGYNGVSPSAYVDTNNGLIHKNQFGATINYHYGEVHQQDGYITNAYSGAKIYFSSMDAIEITDASSGVIYGIANDAFGNPGTNNVLFGTQYSFEEDVLTGTLVPETIISGITIMEY